MRHREVWSTARPVVLGGTGFIGRWVARALTGRVERLHLVVRNANSAREKFAQWKIEGEIVETDLYDVNAIQELLHELDPTVTINLAGYGVNPAERDRHSAYRINAELVEAICDSFSRSTKAGWPGPRLVHVGSALEYGTVSGDLREDSAVNPTTLYGQSKLAGTHALQRCSERTGLRAMVVRLFTVYGPGEADGRLLPSLMRAARRGEVLQLTEGLQRRDFTYVEDVADGLLRLAMVPCEPGCIVNLATGKLHSIREFVECAAPILGLAREQLHFGALQTRPEEMRHEPVNVSRLKQLTGWNPATDIASGIRQTADVISE